MAEEENQSEMSDCDREEEFQTEMKKLVAKRGHLKAQLTRFSTFVNANDDNPECVVELTRRMQKTEYIVVFLNRGLDFLKCNTSRLSPDTSDYQR